MKKIFFCLLLVNSLTKAQSLKWYDGSVVISTGDVIIGKMVVEPLLNVLLVEQNAKQALKVADYGYVMETGKIIIEGNAKDLLNDPGVVEAYLGKRA